MATLSIVTKPASTVFVDGARVGASPINRLQLPAGNHQLQFLAKRSKKRVTKQVTLEEGEVKKLTFDLRKK